METKVTIHNTNIVCNPECAHCYKLFGAQKFLFENKKNEREKERENGEKKMCGKTMKKLCIVGRGTWIMEQQYKLPR